MKLKFLKKAATLLSVGILMTGCSADEITPESETPVEKDSQFFINVSIASPSDQSTRAESDYLSGTDDEQKIHDILFIFYNTANKYVGHTVITLNENKGGGNITDKDGYIGSTEDGDPVSGGNLVDGTGSIETMLNVTVPVSVSAGSLKPAFVLAYVNPTPDRDGDEQRSFDQMIGVTRPLKKVIPYDPKTDIEDDDENTVTKFHKGFTMSNSVYYATDDPTWNRPKIAVAIPDNCLFTSQTTANTSTENVTIYVERVVAKVTLDNSSTFKPIEGSNTIADAGNTTTHTLNFNVLGWGLSNLEKQSFLIKNFRNTEENVTDYDTPFIFTNHSQSGIEAALVDLTNPSWNLSATTNADGVQGCRSFWAFSPTYYSGGRYPSYSDQLNEQLKKEEDYELTGQKPDDYIEPYSLEYLSFNDIMNDVNTTDNCSNPLHNHYDTKGRSCISDKPIYVLEHTMRSGVVNRHQKRAVTCALVIGYYTLDNNTEAKTFYIREGLNSSGEEVNYIYTEESQLKRAILSANTSRIYTKNTVTGKYDLVTSATDLNNFIISHPLKAISEGKYTPERYVSLQFKDIESAIAAGYYLRDANGSYTPINDQPVLDAANQALYGLMNGISKYDGGKAYFAIPIEHLWGKDNLKIGQKKDGESFSAKLGQYGIVRNHLYNIKVTGIEGIGTGIGDPDNPIIPNVEEEKYFVNTKLNVHKWRVVPQQNVTLSPK